MFLFSSATASGHHFRCSETVCQTELVLNTTLTSEKDSTRYAFKHQMISQSFGNSLPFANAQQSSRSHSSHDSTDTVPNSQVRQRTVMTNVTITVNCSRLAVSATPHGDRESRRLPPWTSSTRHGDPDCHKKLSQFVSHVSSVPLHGKETNWTSTSRKTTVSSCASTRPLAGGCRDCLVCDVDEACRIRWSVWQGTV